MSGPAFGRGPPEVGVEEQQVARAVRRIALVELGAPPRAPASMAAALPWFRGDRHTVAPASRATRTVASVEPSLATTTTSTPGSDSAAVTVSPIRSASLYAGMTTATGGMSRC